MKTTRQTYGIRIDSMRYGYATNSSSAHSIIFHPYSPERETTPSEEELSRSLKYWSHEFGWEYFLLATPFQKLVYMLGQFKPIWGLARLRALLKEYKDVLEPHGLTPEELVNRYKEHGWNDPIVDIDHQSRIGTLYERTYSRVAGLAVRPSFKFFADLVRTVVRSDKLQILGGNDVYRYDRYESVPIEELNASEILFSDIVPFDVHTIPLGRYDEEGNFWTIFLPNCEGYRLRFSFDTQSPGYERTYDQVLGMPEEFPNQLVSNTDPTATGVPTIVDHSDNDYRPLVSSLPELVDIKITDYCPFNCPYCYQNSNTGGTHAPLETIIRCAEQLAELGVFEVAIGGGEPTLHPDFHDVLKAFVSRGVLPHFTTRNYQFVQKTANMKELGPVFGSYAVTLDPNDKSWRTKVEKVVEAYKNLYEEKSLHHVRSNLWSTPTNLPAFPVLYHQLYFHLVLGTMTREQFNEVIRKLYMQARIDFVPINITLLDYKRTGRGTSYQPIPYDWWLDDLLRFYKEANQTNLETGCARAETYLAVGIDTPLAERYETQLREAGIPNYLYETREGRHSCYIDLTTNIMALASYGPLRTCSVPYSPDWTKEEFKTKFKLLQSVNDLRDFTFTVENLPV